MHPNQTKSALAQNLDWQTHLQWMNIRQ
jgi:hypothetical protein